VKTRADIKDGRDLSWNVFSQESDNELWQEENVWTATENMESKIPSRRKSVNNVHCGCSVASF